MVLKKTILHPLEYKIGKTLAAEGLVAAGQRILVGVSAGADSIALLHILAALSDQYGLQLVAAYIDHGLRPEETPAEWSRVGEAACALGCTADRIIVDVRHAAAERRQSLEHAARELRYQAFATLAQKWQTERLAVAHTADDQVEEVLLRLFRGGGRRAISGMRPRSGHLIRPLLEVRKQELHDYLREKGISFCFDSSNEDRQYLRNRVRLDLLPLLEAEYDPGIRQALLKTAANLRQDEDLLETLLDESWPQVINLFSSPEETPPSARLDRQVFNRLHPALQRRLIEKLLWLLNNTARYEQILSVCTLALQGQTGQELHLSRGLRVEVSRETLFFSYPRGRGSWRGRLHS
ncbi:MAG: tRNA lysidine(34) synthetase TilS [Desulfobulbus sp.]|nr:tRNA lysidine(34) synthetase TilS [Desulfobulbus sp.]